MMRDEIIQAIHKERERQENLHPDWLGNHHGLAVLMEEVGECAKALYEYTVGPTEDMEKWSKNLDDELVQVASVCVRWLENRCRG